MTTRTRRVLRERLHSSAKWPKTILKVKYDDPQLEVLAQPTLLSRDSLVAWAAGFIDGEGYIYISCKLPRTLNHSTYYQFGVVVCCVDIEPIRRLAAIFGGIVQPVRVRPECRPQYRWELRGNRAANCLLEMQNLLCVKKERAYLGIELQKRVKNTIGSGGPSRDYYAHNHLSVEEVSEREKLYQQMRLLNKRGVNNENS